MAFFPYFLHMFKGQGIRKASLSKRNVGFIAWKDKFDALLGKHPWKGKADTLLDEAFVCTKALIFMLFDEQRKQTKNTDSLSKIKMPPKNYYKLTNVDAYCAMMFNSTFLIRLTRFKCAWINATIINTSLLVWTFRIQSTTDFCGKVLGVMYRNE